MASAFVNGCLFRAASAGSGDFVVDAAVTGWHTPAQASAVNATQYTYRAFSDDLTEWEIGYGDYTTGSTTLARTTIIASSNSNNKVTFTAAPQVALTAAAADLIAASLLTAQGDIIYRNATVPARLAKGTADQVLTMNAGATAPEWQTPAVGAQIATGSYTGDGATSQAITGIGFQPIYVKVWHVVMTGASAVVFTTDTFLAGTGNSVAQAQAGATNDVSDKIIAVGSDGFTVDDAGSDAHPNTNGETYYYLVIG